MENKKQVSTTLKVSTGVVKRAVKELEMYRQEVDEGENKLKTMPTNDNFYSQTQKALEESRTVLSRTEERLKTALADLESKMKGVSQDNEDLADASTWTERAKAIISTN